MKLILIATALLLFGCQSTPDPPVRSQYRLIPAQSSDAIAKAAPVSRVQIAEYLHQPGIIIEDEEGALHPARYHQWSESLVAALRRLLNDEISAGEANSDARVEVFVERFHGTMRGRAVMAARYDILTGEELIASHRFSREVPLRSAGYPALIDAQRRLTRELASAISASLSEVSSP